jgi:hypothetical protein
VPAERAGILPARLLAVGPEFAHCSGGEWWVYLTSAVLGRRGQAGGDDGERTGNNHAGGIVSVSETHE